MIEWIVGLSVSERWIYGIIFGGIVAVVVQWFSQRLNHSLASRRERHKTINSAKDRLRFAFAPAQAKIRISPQDSTAIYNFIGTFLAGHATAVEEFREFVPKRKRRAYQEAWDKYYKTATQGSPKTRGAAYERDITIAQLFENKIHDILRFTE